MSYDRVSGLGEDHVDVFGFHCVFVEAHNGGSDLYVVDFKVFDLREAFADRHDAMVAGHAIEAECLRFHFSFVLL